MWTSCFICGVSYSSPAPHHWQGLSRCRLTVFLRDWMSVCGSKYTFIWGQTPRFLRLNTVLGYKTTHLGTQNSILLMIHAFTLRPSLRYFRPLETRTHATTSLLPNSVIMQIVSICVSVHKHILVIAICLFYAVKFVSLITNQDSQMHFILDFFFWAWMHICYWKQLRSSLFWTGRFKNIILHLLNTALFFGL